MSQVFVGMLDVKTCPVEGCGVVYGVEARANALRLERGGSWFCTNGHALSYIKTEIQKLKEELESEKQSRLRAEQRETAAHERRRATERSRNAIKGVLTRIAKRVAAGVCPCCNRSFGNLSRHMSGQHPDYVHNHQEEKPVNP